MSEINKEIITKVVIKDFLIINCTGKNDTIGLRVDSNFFIQEFQINSKNNEMIVNNILDFVNGAVASSVAVDDPGQEVQLPLNADAFADRVARLISNSENLLSIETVIRNRVRQFMLDRYDKASADDVDDKLDVLTRKAGEFSDDIDAPMGHGAGASKLA